MVTASRRAYLISPGDILQPWCKAGQGIRLICIADRVRFANSAFMIFRPELHCLWRLDKKKTVEKKKKKERKGEKEGGRGRFANDFHDGFPTSSLGRKIFKNCLEICLDRQLHFYERKQEKRESDSCYTPKYSPKYNLSRHVW